MLTSFSIINIILVAINYLLPLIVAIVVIKLLINLDRNGKEMSVLRQKQVYHNLLLQEELSSLNKRMNNMETLLKEVD